MYPAVVDVTAKDEHTLLVRFDNGQEGTLDMTPYLNFGVFSRLRNPVIFQTVRVAFDTIEWEGGIDLDPEFVYNKTVLSVA